MSKGLSESENAIRGSILKERWKKNDLPFRSIVVPTEEPATAFVSRCRLIYPKELLKYEIVRYAINSVEMQNALATIGSFEKKLF